MKLTLLEIVSDILNDIDGDEVGSISDTIESLQVANIVKSTYLSLSSNKDWSYQRKLFELTASGDNTLPTTMYVPTTYKRVDEISYNIRKSTDTRDRFQLMEYIHPSHFLNRTNKYNSSATNIQTITNADGVKYFVRNDQAPSYYTSFDDVTLVFDSYDSLVDTTLQRDKTQAVGYEQNTFDLTDLFIPKMPNEAFVLLLEESKSAASLKLRQMVDSKAEQRSKAQQRWLSRNDWVVSGGVRYQDFGRSSRKGYTSSTARSPYFPPKR
jgi:hypothetical protein